MAERKKYWIKLEKDFLNSSQIKVIKNLPNGKDYIIFYLALMLESTSTEGHLRFSELVPYNEDMLASITDTNIDIVRSAMKVFLELGMIQVLENGTLFLPEVPRRIGKECESAERVRLFRENQKALQCNSDVTKCNDIKKEDKEEDKDNNRHIFGEFKHVRLTNEELRRLNEDYGEAETKRAIKYLDEYIEMKGAKYKNHNLVLRKWVFDALKERAQKNSQNFMQHEYTRKDLDGLFDNLGEVDV